LLTVPFHGVSHAYTHTSRMNPCSIYFKFTVKVTYYSHALKKRGRVRALVAAAAIAEAKSTESAATYTVLAKCCPPTLPQFSPKYTHSIIDAL